MSPSFNSKFAVTLALLLAACVTQISQTSAPMHLPPSPTPDLGIITPENVSRLVQIQQLGMGVAFGIPLYSPDGKRLFQATSTGVFVFDTSDYANERLLFAHSTGGWEDKIMDVSPNGKIVAIGNNLVDAENGQKMPDLEQPQNFTKPTHVYEAKFSPDSLLIARVYKDAKTGQPLFVGVWRLADGKILHIFDVKTPLNSLNYSLGFSTDGQRMTIQIIAPKNEPNIFLYDTQTGEQLTGWIGNRSVFLPENRLAVESADGAIRIFDLETKTATHAFFGEFAAFSPDGQFIALLNFGEIKVYRIADEQQVSVLKGDFTYIDGVVLRFSPDGQTIAGNTADYCCGGHEDHFYLWQTTNGALIKKFNEPIASELFYFSPDNKSLAITSRLGTTQILNTADGSLIADVGAYSSLATGVAFLPNGRQLVVAAAGDSGEHSTFVPDNYYQAPLFFYEVASGKLYKSQPTEDRYPKLAFSTDGKIYAPSELYDLPSMRQTGNIGSIAFSPDGKKMAIGGGGGLFLWDISQKKLLLHASNYPGQITSLDFSPDGKRLVLACVAGFFQNEYPEIQIWEAVANGNLAMKISGREVSMVVFSPDGRFVATGGKKGVVVWNALNGVFQFSIDESILGYYGLGAVGAQRFSFSPDGRILAIGLLDSTVELWDTEKETKIYSVKIIDSQYSPVYDLDFSPDGKLLAAGFEDGGVRIYGIK